MVFIFIFGNSVVVFLFQGCFGFGGESVCVLHVSFFPPLLYVSFCFPSSIISLVLSGLIKLAENMDLSHLPSSLSKGLIRRDKYMYEYSHLSSISSH